MSVEEVARAASPAVVQIMTFDIPEGPPTGQGSGFFVSRDGLVATNYHVIAGARAATVTLATGETYSALGYVAADPRTDVAVLRIAQRGFRSLDLANSDSVSPGAEVIALGSPRGFQETVSTGVSSQLRLIDGVWWLQHSAPISPGSSGGPLLDRLGHVIGINSRFRTDAQNLNFAVPSNSLRALLPGDTLKPLAALPRGGGWVAATAHPDSGGPPTGVTNLYEFTSPAAGFNFVFLVELPDGGLSGTLFSPHPSGFLDVVPISDGSRTMQPRDFRFSVGGCLEFWGWIRSDGRLGGDSRNACGADQPVNSAFEAAPFYSDPSRLPYVSGAKLWLLRLGRGSDSLWALLATISPRDLAEATVGTLFAWRQPGEGSGSSRFSVVFGQGGVGDSIGAWWLQARDSSARMELREQSGAVAGALTLLAPSDTLRFNFRGYREDLDLCFWPKRIFGDVAEAQRLERRARELETRIDDVSHLTEFTPRPDASSAESVRVDSANTVIRHEKYGLPWLQRAKTAVLSNLRVVQDRIVKYHSCPSMP